MKLPSTHNGSTGRRHRSYIASPWEKSITSSSVPCMTNTGAETLLIFSILKIFVSLIINITYVA